MGAQGFEPRNDVLTRTYKNGRDMEISSPVMSQAGRGQKDTSVEDEKSRTDIGRDEIMSGHDSSTTGTQQNLVAADSASPAIRSSTVRLTTNPKTLPEPAPSSPTTDAETRGTALPQDLAELAALWPTLPEAVKLGWLATARALAGK